MTELETFRRQKDRYLKTSPDSPIPPDQRGDFAGLAFYPENAGLRLIVQPEEFAEQEPIRMITSTGGEQEYLRWGRFSFEVEEQPATLTIYDVYYRDNFTAPYREAQRHGSRAVPFTTPRTSLNRTVTGHMLRVLFGNSNHRQG